MTSTTDRAVTPWPTRHEREGGPARRARTATRASTAPPTSGRAVERPSAYVPRHALLDPEVTERPPIVVPAQRTGQVRPAPGPRPAATPRPPRPAVGSAVHEVRPDRPTRNGLGLAAVCLGAIGLPLGLAPVTGFAAAGLGVLALVFGIAGWARVRSGVASNRGAAVTGAVLGLIALGLGVAATVAFVRAPDRLVYDVDALTGGSPAAVFVTSTGE